MPDSGDPPEPATRAARWWRSRAGVDRDGTRWCRFVVVAVLVVAGCGEDEGGDAVASDTTSATAATLGTGSGGDGGIEVAADGTQRFPDVIGAEVERSADGTLRFDVTISSPYDTPERYADAWRVVGADGTVYGVRELAHDHANEQPFTRSLIGVEITDAVRSVTIEGRDLVHGWGGATLDVDLPPPGDTAAGDAS